MSKFNCPHCKQPVFSCWDKYFAAKWKVLTCPCCNKRACSLPILLALYYLLYLMDVIDFGFMSYVLDDMSWIAVAIVGWVILDVFSVYLPLAALGGTKIHGSAKAGTVTG